MKLKSGNPIAMLTKLFYQARIAWAREKKRILNILNCLHIYWRQFRILVEESSVDHIETPFLDYRNGVFCVC
jgi:hypothetical protein